MISVDILKPIIINLDGSPGLVVMGGNLFSVCHGFESQRQAMDEPFLFNH